MQRTLKHALAVAVVSAGVAAPNALAQGQDLRSPDAQDAANGTSAPLSDLRSPDARDAASELRYDAAATPPANTSPSATDSTSWYEEWAVIAGAGLALLLAAGGAVLFEHHRRAVRVAARP